MAQITRKDRSSVQVVMPAPAYEAIQQHAKQLSTTGKRITASDVVRMALAEYFERLEKPLDFSVPSGGYRERKGNVDE
jgi:hypothetical protein